MKLTKKLLTATVISGAVFTGAQATDTTIDAAANFLAAVTFANETAMDFGDIEFSGTAAAANIDIDAADGSLTSSSVEYTVAATGTVGSVEVEGTTGATIDISCSTGGTLANAAGDNTITLDSTEINFNGAADVACAGAGTSPTNVTLTSGTDTISMGGNLALAAAPNAEAYSTTNTNGVAVTVRAVYN